jgi:hypothetical protein
MRTGETHKPKFSLTMVTTYYIDASRLSHGQHIPLLSPAPLGKRRLPRVTTQNPSTGDPEPPSPPSKDSSGGWVQVVRKAAVYRTRDKKRNGPGVVRKEAAGRGPLEKLNSEQKIISAHVSRESLEKRRRQLGAFHTGSRRAQRDRFNFALAACTIDCVAGVHCPDCPLYLTTLKKEKEETDSPALLPGIPTPTECANLRTLKSLFKQVQKLLQLEQGLARTSPPQMITCGGLRAALESSYDHLTIVQALSVKTAQKLEPQPCKFCEERFASLVDEWKMKRKQPQVVDDTHLTRFQKALSQNIPSGWNKKFRAPFVPNGHGSLHHGRSAHGNWNEEEFASEFRTELVFSSGKPRVVTLYSSRNTALLKPLHSALFGQLKRRNWLLVGPPTSERVKSLKGFQYESFDYKSATDNIKSSYVSTAVETLIQKGVDLTYEEVEALRVVSDLTIDGEQCGSGQPMGSLMSFPLLCLINKTMVDLALVDTLSKDGVNFPSKGAWETFVTHKALVNGDDLALRDPTGNGEFRKWLVFHGKHVGLGVNEEKSLTSVDWLEINSTAFFQGDLKKKTNVGALRCRKQDCGDMLALAEEATNTTKGFNYLLTASSSGFALQTHKHVRKHPKAIPILCREPRLRSALKKFKKEKIIYNPFPVTETPDGYELTSEEIFDALSEEVPRVRPIVLSHAVDRSKDELSFKIERKHVEVGGKRFSFAYKDYHLRTQSSVLRRKHAETRDHTLVCLVEAWKRKKMVDLEISRPGVWAYETVHSKELSARWGELEEGILLPPRKENVMHSSKSGTDALKNKNSLETPSRIQKLQGMIRTARALDKLKIDRPSGSVCVDPLTGDHTPLSVGTEVEACHPIAPCGAFRFGAGG